MKLILLTVFFGLGSTLTTDNCPLGLKRDKSLQVYGSYCYKFPTSAPDTYLDYFDARKVCAKYNGTLAMPKTKNINNFLSKQLQEAGIKRDTWIGLNDDVSEELFYWEDNTQMGWDNFGENEGPDNFFLLNHWEDCVAMSPEDGVWHDHHCETTLFGIIDQRKPFVCQYPAVYNIATSAPPKAKSTGCPSIECDLDCGMLGYVFDSNQCLLCKCGDS